MLFSPSGHRLYVARAAAPLLVLDRVDGAQLHEIELPGPARELRGDMYGRWLLVRPEQGDSVWVIDVGTGKYVGSTGARWSDDLPAVAPPPPYWSEEAPIWPASISRPPDSPSWDASRVEQPTSGFRLPGSRRSETELPFESDSALAAADTGPARPTVYLQVSSSQNPTWANELSAKLSAAGLPASVLAPRRSEEVYRVVLGPYATREQAEATGRKIGMPSFVVTAQEQSTAQ